MKQKKFFTTALAAICAFSSFPTLPCAAGDGRAATEHVYVALEAERSTYIFKNNGYTDTISVYGITESGAKAALGDAVQYSSSDTDIVSVYQDSIRAKGKGTAGITAQYAGLTLEIPVVVQNQIDLDALEASLRLPEHLPSPDSTPADEILDRAASMKNVLWAPQKDFSVQGNAMVFTAGQHYEGIPYSPLTQVDDVQFLEKLAGADDFYTPVSMGSYQNGGEVSSSFPRYGTDCSGYVSSALGIQRLSSAQMVKHLKNNTGEIRKLGSYDPDAPTKESMYESYQKLQPGNAIAHYGHAALVLSNDTSSESVVVYEMTNRFPQVTIYEYSTLWNGGRNCYFPFCENRTAEYIERNKGGKTLAEAFSTLETYSTYTKGKGSLPEAPYRPQPLKSGAMLDLDGDGTAEKITYRAEENPDTGNGCFAVTVKGTTCRIGNFPDGTASNVSLCYASLDGMTTQLMLRQHDDWAADFCEVYTYKNGTFALAGIFPDADYGMLTVDGQAIFSCVGRCHPLQNDMVEVYYKFEDGRLEKIKKNYYRFLETCNGGRTIFRLRQDMALYAKRSSNQTFTLPKGSLAVVLGGDLADWIYIKDTKSGKTGWLKGSGGSDGALGSYWADECILPDGSRVPCGELLEGLRDYN